MATRSEVLLESSDSDWQVTRDQFDCWTDTLAARFRARGIGPGDVVVADLPNSPALLVALHAAWAVGAACAPISPLLTRREKTAIIDLVEPRLTLSSARRAPGEWSTAWPGTFGEPPDIDESRVRPATEPVADETDDLILFTSGSTGKPKAVALTTDNVFAGTNAVTKHFTLTPEDRTIGWLPWTHGHGLFATLLAPLASGGTIVLPTQRETSQPHQLLAAARPTWVSCVPAQLAIITDALARSGAQVSGIRFVRTASAPLPRALAERAEYLVGAPVAEALGLTETSHQVCANPGSSGRVLGTVGVPSPGMQIGFAGEDILGGGVLQVRGPGVFRAYLRNAEATAEVLTPDRWFSTGDLAAFEDGRIRIIGRLGDLINRGGYKVAPAEIEAVLAQHHDVMSSVVSRIPHPSAGEEVAAAIVLRPGAAAEKKDLLRHCQANLAAYKVPGHIELLDGFPTLTSGKVDRRQVSELLKVRSR